MPNKLGLKLQYLREVCGAGFVALRERGIAGTLKSTVSFFKRRSNGQQGGHLPRELELERQRQEGKTGWPSVSVVLRPGSGDRAAIARFAKSMLWQTYGGWQLVVPGAEKPAEDARIIGGGDAPHTAADSDIVAFADADAMLAPHAVYWLARTALENPDKVFFYADDAPYTGDIHQPGEARLKTGWSREYYYSMDYIGSFVALRQEALAAIPADLNTPSLVLAAAEKGGGARVPHVLYYYFERDTAATHRVAVQEYLAQHCPGAVVENGLVPGTNHVVYPLEGRPLVSIIIPNMDHVEDLRRCLVSLYEKTGYRNFETIVVENNSRQGATFAYYQSAKLEYEGLRVENWQGEGFNFSALCNFGRRVAKGEYLLFLNNDTEVTAPGWLEEMLRFCALPDVGAVGALLRYEDGTVQHAGVLTVSYTRWCAVHSHRMCNGPGYMNRILTVQEYNVVTGACLMVKAADFDALGGFDENLAVGYNDVQLCLQLRDKGKRVIYTPYAELIHNESKSRGIADDPQKVERALREMHYIRWRWGTRWDVDEYYHPAFTQTDDDYSMDEPMNLRYYGPYNEVHL